MDGQVMGRPALGSETFAGPPSRLTGELYTFMTARVAVREPEGEPPAPAEVQQQQPRALVAPEAARGAPIASPAHGVGPGPSGARPLLSSHRPRADLSELVAEHEENLSVAASALADAAQRALELHQLLRREARELQEAARAPGHRDQQSFQDALSDLDLGLLKAIGPLGYPDRTLDFVADNPVLLPGHLEPGRFTRGALKESLRTFLETTTASWDEAKL